MKIKCSCKLLLSSLVCMFVLLTFPVKAKVDYPTPTAYKYVNDYVQLLDNTTARNIISIGKELEDKTGAQAVVVIVSSTNGVPIENYAINLFRGWGIGQKGKDNGLLVLISTNDRNWRVEVGRGLEGAIPDALSNRIMESIAKPKFIDGDYNTGILNSYSTLCDNIAKEYNITLEKSLKITLPNDYSLNRNQSIGGGIILGFLVLSLILDLVFNRGRIFSTILNLIFISNLGRRGPRGGGGGFGGFGGGSSNGGGSSGSW